MTDTDPITPAVALGYQIIDRLDPEIRQQLLDRIDNGQE